MRAVGAKIRIIVWVAIPAILIGLHIAAGGETGEAPLLMTGGLTGLGGLTILSERWRQRAEEEGEIDEPHPEGATRAGGADSP